MKKIRKTAALILCVILLVNVTACVPFAFPFAGANTEEGSQEKPSLFDGLFQILHGNEDTRPETAEENGPEVPAAEKPDESGNSGSDGTDASVKEGDAGDFMPAYYHYDKADFEAIMTKIESAAKAQDEDALEEAYEEGYNELIKLDDLYSASYLQYSDDVSNPSNEEEMNYTETLVLDCIDQMSTICHYIVTEGKNSAFESYLDEEVCDYFREYVPVTDEIKKLMDRETDLVTDYYREMTNIDKYTVESGGKTWTMEELNSDAGVEIAQQNPMEYLNAYMDILGQFNAVVGPMYLELIQIRMKIAQFYGYDNYAEYRYEEVYHRDYSMEEAEKFCSDIKQSIAPLYYNTVYYGGALDGDFAFDSDVQGLLQDLGTLAKTVSPVSEKAYELLTSEKLYDLGYEKKRIESSYTSVVTGTGKPYIFAHLNDQPYDFLTMTHEFGHFSYFSQAEQANYFLSENHLDLMEMHSNGFELLCTKYYDQFFGNDADTAEAYALGEILANVVQGCIMDEFQRKLYEKPDMTLKEINELYAQVASSYGEPVFGEEAYEWCLVPHNFESPLYYLSYAVSAVTALEIWDLSQDDYAKGVKAWEDLVDYTDENEGYLKTLEKCGLSPITETDKADRICRDAVSKISELIGAGGMNYGFEDFDDLFPDGFSWDDFYPDMISPEDFGVEPGYGYEPEPTVVPEEPDNHVA